MTNLSSFAELMQKAAEDKKLRQVQEIERKKTEVAPLLSELFATVAKAKVITKETDEKEAPLLAELQDALTNPNKFKTESKEKKDKIIEMVAELEEKANSIQSKVENVQEKPSDLEKKFLKLFNRLQNDFQTLKKHVETTYKASSPMGWGGSGGGEVKVLRMDDVDKTNLQDGAVMTYSASLNKMVFTMPTGGGTITDEEMPYAKRVDFVTDNELYKGEATVGSLENDPVWRIHKIVIGADSDVTETWADGVSTYTKTWSNRLTYNYI